MQNNINQLPGRLKNFLTLDEVVTFFTLITSVVASINLGFWLRAWFPDGFSGDLATKLTTILVTVALALGFFVVQRLLFTRTVYSKRVRLTQLGVLGAMSVAGAFSIVYWFQGQLGLNSISRLAAVISALFAAVLAPSLHLLVSRAYQSLSAIANKIKINDYVPEVLKRDWTQKFYNFIATSYFPIVRNVEAEQRKLNIARIIVGIIAFVRTFLILAASIYYFPLDNLLDIWITVPREVWFALAMCGLWILFILGFFTPVVTLSLLLFYNEFDFFLSTQTLGTNILTGLILYFLFTNAGQYFSLDSRHLKGTSKHWISVLIKKIYSFIGFPGKEQLTIYNFILFGGYAIISLGAIQHHFRDEYWRAGQTVSVLMTSSYLSRFYEISRWFEESYPLVFRFFSAFGGLSQTAYQIFMLPLVWLKWGKRYVVAWGLMFFLISTFVLQLSYLPFLELVMWAICFLETQSESHVKIIYDDHCYRCTKIVRTLSLANFIGIFEFVPGSKSFKILSQHKLGINEIQENIHGIWKSKVYKGYELYDLISKTHPLFYPLFPILKLGELSQLGPVLYKRIARNRHEHLGNYEEFQPVGKERKTSSRPIHRQSYVFSNSIIGLILVAWLLFIGTFPFANSIKPMIPTILRPKKLLYRLGFEVPNVFNENDLKMGDQWFIIYEELADGTTRRLLLNGLDGEREFLHYSDLLYFGNSLRWRRLMRSADLIASNQPGELGYYYIYRMAQFFYRSYEHSKPVTYQIKIYKNQSSNVTILDFEERYSPELVYEFKLEISPEKLEPPPLSGLGVVFGYTF